jgi:hypothetical protein
VLVKSESSDLEFKESYGQKSFYDWSKTFAAFANAHGGHMIFGVSSVPHKLSGLSEDAYNTFNKHDNAIISGDLNSYFSPSINWGKRIHVIGEKRFGIIYIHESTNKPAVCTKSKDSLFKEGDIYYRYEGRTERIKYPELNALIQAVRDEEKSAWLNLIENIGKIGIGNVNILDRRTGDLFGDNHIIRIDQASLGQAMKHRQDNAGLGSEKKTIYCLTSTKAGAGNRENPSINVVEKPILVRPDRVILDFLNSSMISDPKEYIKLLCYETTPYMPVYYYIFKAGISINDTIHLINSTNRKSQNKVKIINRLTNKTTQFTQLLQSKNKNTLAKRSMVNRLAQQQAIEVSIENSRTIFAATRGLGKDAIADKSNYIRQLYIKLFEKYSDFNSAIASEYRRAVCWIDEAIYMDKVVN